MKNIYLQITFLLITVTSGAQIGHEHTYPGSATLTRLSISGPVNNDTGTFPFPNPADNRITIPFQFESGCTQGSIEIIDQYGRTLIRQELNIHNTLHDISVSGMPAGSYSFTILSGNRILVTGKFIHP